VYEQLPATFYVHINSALSKDNVISIGRKKKAHMHVEVFNYGLSLQPGDLLAWLLVGLIAGFFASVIIRGRSYGCIGNIIVGLIGAVIGGFLGNFLNLGRLHFIGTTVVAFLGACVLVAILQFFNGGRRSY
jgi:uncharacterized membrane protein YeaQ/YmgE (transglycosylase-associated protein family)